MSILFEPLSYTTTCSSFKLIDQLFLSFHTHTHTIDYLVCTMHNAFTPKNIYSHLYLPGPLPSVKHWIPAHREPMFFLLKNQPIKEKWLVHGITKILISLAFRINYTSRALITSYKITRLSATFRKKC